MVRSFYGHFTFLILLGAGLAMAQTQPGSPGKADAQKTTQGESALRFDMSRFLQEHDTNKDGTLDKSELPARLQERFAQLDTNKDGKLSKDELEKGVAFLQPSRRPADVLFVLIEMSDCDECCLEEIQHFYTMLRKLDKNNDGKLCGEELAAARKGLVEERVGNLFKELDGDKDGRINREEARGYVRKDFDRLDINKDNFLDRDELTKAAALPPTVKPEGKPKGQ